MPAPERQQGDGPGSGTRWSAARWSTVLAAASLVAALIFNGIQTRNAAQAQNEARLATELGLLTQLQNVMSESVYERVHYAPQFVKLRNGYQASLTKPAYRATVEEAANMDYLAWLFNHGHLTTEGADQLWGPRMVCEYKRAFAPALQNPAQDLPELVEFIRERGRELTELGQRC